MGSHITEVVDLTSSASHQTPISSTSIPSFASSSQFPQQALRGVKRRRTNNHRSSSGSSSEIHLGAEDVETIDITGDGDANELAKAVAKQRQDAIKAQQSTEKSDRPRSALMAYKCPICMDTPVDVTTTLCGMYLVIYHLVIRMPDLADHSLTGHLFCHKCIIDYLRITEENSTKQTRHTCPVCRKHISDKEIPKIGRTIIPIAFKIHTKTRSELEALQKQKHEEE